jgi:hypothetical protein
MSNGNSFFAVWRPGTGAQYWASDLGYDEFKAQDLKHFNQGLRLVSLRRHGNRFTGIWHPGTGTQWWSTGLGGDDFKAKDKAYFEQGLRLIDMDVQDDGYTAVWRPGTGAQWWSTNLDFEAFKQKDKEHFNAGLRLGCVRVQSNGQFTGFWHPGNGTQWWQTGISVAAFKAKDAEYFAQGLRLVDIDYHNGSLTGVWRSGGGAQHWVSGQDTEMFKGSDMAYFDGGMRLQKAITYSGACDSACLNQVVMPKGVYNYGITGDSAVYRWPCLTSDGSKRFARMSALSFPSVSLFTLPYSDPVVNELGKWLYEPGSWHHAIDYQRGDKASFPVLAAAAGKVIFSGWDWWSGNTIVVSHDVDGVADAFRTIYMHLRNGVKHDADQAWNVSAPGLNGVRKSQYQAYLTNTGCPKGGPYLANPGFWGTDADKIDPNIVGKTVAAGAQIAHAGCTGPGGCGCTNDSDPSWKWGGSPNNHLHIFFCRRDPTDNEWYFVDPYGIYSSGSCYPGVNNPITSACARYPKLWKGGKAQFH